MLTDIEKRYVADGYTLPAGLTWPIVHSHRRMFSLPDRHVPIRTGAVVLSGLPVELSVWGVYAPDAASSTT